MRFSSFSVSSSLLQTFFSRWLPEQTVRLRRIRGPADGSGMWACALSVAGYAEPLVVGVSVDAAQPNVAISGPLAATASALAALLRRGICQPTDPPAADNTHALAVAVEVAADQLDNVRPVEAANGAAELYTSWLSATAQLK